MQLDIPIVLIIFRRKNTALKVIDAIAKVKPKKLYISQDGPRNSSEKEHILETRKAVLSRINWDCELVTWFHKKNLGFKNHIPPILDKIFEMEDCCIYLEDDTLPSKQFFILQKELLEKYKHDKRIFAIKGVNLYPELTKTKHSYYLSQIGGCWGIGMWKRTWALYESEPKDLDNFRYAEYKKFIFSKKFFLRLKFFLKLVGEGKLDAWDYQLTYAAIKNKMYFINSCSNLVKNIGVEDNPTNIFLKKYSFSLDSESVDRIFHPRKLIYQKKLDKGYYQKMYKFTYLRLCANKIFYHLPDTLRDMAKNILRGSQTTND